MTKNDSFEAYIVPWALPGEYIPLNVTWDKEFEFDHIQVILPSDFKFIEILNVAETSFNKKDNVIIINKIMKSALGTLNYFGLVIASSKIYNELKVSKKIKIKFIRNDETIKSLELYGRIFRPCLEVIEAPDVIVVPEKKKIRTLPLHLKYVGFGDIRLQIDAFIGGKIVSHGESMIYELLKRLWILKDTMTKKEEIEKGEMEKKKIEDLQIHPEYLKKVAEEIREKVEFGITPSEEIDEKVVEDLRNWLQDLKASDRFVEIFYTHVEDVLVSLLVDLLDRNPTENVRLVATKTKLKTKITAPITNITLELKYRDLMNNEYIVDPIKIPIKIEGRKELEKGVEIDMSVIIEWDDKPFLNVKEMKISEEEIKSEWGCSRNK